MRIKKGTFMQTPPLKSDTPFLQIVSFCSSRPEWRNTNAWYPAGFFRFRWTTVREKMCLHPSAWPRCLRLLAL